MASQCDLAHFLEKLPKLFNTDAVQAYIKKFESQPQVIENLLSIRNAILLYKALKNERIREVFLCVNGFNTFKLKYPYFCKFRTQFLYPKK